MPWVRIDDQFPQHPKIAKVGPLGLALQVAGLCYCNRYLTDGFIPNEVLNGLLTGCSTPDLETTVKRLIEAQVWEETVDGVHIHDYLDYQPSKAQIMAERERNRIAGRISAQQRAQRSVDTVSTRTQAQPRTQVPSTPPHPTLDSAPKNIGASPSPKRKGGLKSQPSGLGPDFEERMVTKFPALSPELIHDQIELAISHVNAKKYDNTELYVQNWLRREAQNAKSNRNRSTGTSRGSPSAQWPSAAHIPRSEHARDLTGETGAPLPPELRRLAPMP